jgi:hypothetical protein
LEKEGVQTTLKGDRIGGDEGDEGLDGMTRSAAKTPRTKASKAKKSKASTEDNTPNTVGQKRKAAGMEEEHGQGEMENSATVSNDNVGQLKEKHEEIRMEDQITANSEDATEQ